MVPDEGIEPPTFGLQNRCSTAELIRQSMENQIVRTKFAIPFIGFFFRGCGR
jgi:hypothetical protein